MIVFKLLPDMVEVHIRQDFLRQLGRLTQAEPAQFLVTAGRMDLAPGQILNAVDGLSRGFRRVPHRVGGKDIALTDAQCLQPHLQPRPFLGSTGQLQQMIKLSHVTSSPFRPAWGSLPCLESAAQRHRKVRSTPFPPEGENSVHSLALPLPT